MKDSIFLVSFDLDGELLCSRESGLVSEREESNLIQGIGGIGDQLSKEDLGERGEDRERERERGKR